MQLSLAQNPELEESTTTILVSFSGIDETAEGNAKFPQTTQDGDLKTIQKPFWKDVNQMIIVSGLTFRSLIHFEFIFVYGVRKFSNFILLHIVDNQSS